MRTVLCFIWGSSAVEAECVWMAWANCKLQSWSEHGLITIEWQLCVVGQSCCRNQCSVMVMIVRKGLNSESKNSFFLPLHILYCMLIILSCMSHVSCTGWRGSIWVHMTGFPYLCLEAMTGCWCLVWSQRQRTSSASWLRTSLAQAPSARLSLWTH